VAKRRKKSAASKKPAKNKANAQPKKNTSAKKSPTKRNKGKKRRGTAAPAKAASRAGSATLLPPKGPRTTARRRETKDIVGEAATTSDRGIAGIDGVRTIIQADQAPGGSCPMQTGEHVPPIHATQIAKGADEKEDRLEEIRDRLSDSGKVEVDRGALLWAGTSRLPRTAIVGRALHDLRSFTAELASKRGTAVSICSKIQARNAAHLRAAILNTLASAKPQERIDAALVGYLNKAWAVLEKLLYLEAAPRAGVYLNEEGQRVFNGFPDWEDVDEPWPTKPTRPPTRPRS